MNGKKLLVPIVMLLAMVTPALAMSVEYFPSYQQYKPQYAWNWITGVNIDDSSAGYGFDLNEADTRSIAMYNPDYNNKYWWVYVSMLNPSLNTTDQIEPNPPTVYNVTVSCVGSGGTWNLINEENSTWSSGYVLWRLAWNVEQNIPLASADYSPTGQDLYTKQTICSFAVANNSLPSGNFLTFRIWAENPDLSAQCGEDDAQAFIISATLGIIDMNYQVWLMIYNLFIIAIILIAVFGIPIALIRLVRKLLDELEGKKKVF